MVERQNYLKVKVHLKYLEEVLQLAPVSVERYRFYLRHLLLWADGCKLQDVERIRPTLPVYLTSLPGKNGQGTLAAGSQKKVLDSSKRFFRWAKSTYPREFNRLSPEWIETLRLPRHPKVSSENIFVSLEEVKQLLSYSPDPGNLALLRDQAAAALLFLSGMRAGAFATLPIAALDLAQLTVRQYPELGVHTKNGKKATTFLLNIPELLASVRVWDEIVRPALSPEAPWYAPVDHCWGEQCISSKEPGQNRSRALEKRLRLLFSLVGVPHKSPHKFRHGHAVYGLLHAQTMADYKAVSMNLMHDSIEITDSTYAPMLSSDVKDRIAGLSAAPTPAPEHEAPLADGPLEHYLNELGKEDLGRTLVFIAERLTK
jgi:integrase